MASERQRKTSQSQGKDSAVTCGLEFSMTQYNQVYGTLDSFLGIIESEMGMRQETRGDGPLQLWLSFSFPSRKNPNCTWATCHQKWPISLHCALSSILRDWAYNALCLASHGPYPLSMNPPVTGHNPSMRFPCTVKLGHLQTSLSKAASQV